MASITLLNDSSYLGVYARLNVKIPRSENQVLNAAF